MAISIISGGALTGGINNGGSVTLTFPVGVQQDDVVYVCSGIDGTVSPSTAGYTELATITSGGHRVGVWRKIMGVTPDASVTISGTGQPQDAHTAVALILRGVEVTQPEDATSTTASGSSTDPNNPAITTNTNTALVLAFASSRVNDTAITAPSGYNNQTNIAVSDTKPLNHSSSNKRDIPPAGVEDPASWTDWASGHLGGDYCRSSSRWVYIRTCCRLIRYWASGNSSSKRERASVSKWSGRRIRCRERSYGGVPKSGSYRGIFDRPSR